MSPDLKIRIVAFAFIGLSCAFGFSLGFLLLSLAQEMKLKTPLSVRLRVASFFGMAFAFIGFLLSLFISQPLATQLDPWLSTLGLPDQLAATPTSTMTPLPAPSQLVTTPTPVFIFGVHTVKPGEDLLCIAQAYGIDPIALAQANGLKTNISPGDKLLLPAKMGPISPESPRCERQVESPFVTPSVTFTPGITATQPNATNTP